ncbi:MAG: flagellar basal body rod protein FlgB [Chitinispirillaceae bacterium]
MLSDALFSKTNLPVVSKGMDAAMLRARVISNNVANVNTPGFRRVEVKFEDQMRKALDATRLEGARTSQNHLEIGRRNMANVNAEAYHPYDPSQPSGVNNVDIDMEMAKLAETQIMYNYANRFRGGVFKKLNAAIKARPLQ